MAWYDGNTHWLEIATRTNGGGAYATLSPRQPVTPAPYAIYAVNAGTLGGSVTADSIASLTSNLNAEIAARKTADNTGLNYTDTSLASETAARKSGDADTLTAAKGYTDASLASETAARKTGDSDTLTAAENYTDTAGVSYWHLTGNAGTVAGDFLGTTDNQPLELKVNNSRALRLEPNANGAPNVVGGASVNFVAPGIIGAVIAGGGATNYLGISINSVAANFGSIGGGNDNAIQSGADGSTIGGGQLNTATNSLYSTIGGGSQNLIQSSGGATIGGGAQNMILTNATESTIGGESQNIIQGASFLGALNATISGGYFNLIQTNATFATIGGGAYNMIQNYAGESTIGGGYGNTNTGYFATIPGGSQNVATNYALAAGYRAKANHTGAFVWADNTEADFASTTSNQFAVRATGGVVINAGTNNLELAGGGLKVTGAGVDTATPVFVHRATAGNVGLGGSSHITYIDNPYRNGQPNAILFVTHNWSQDSAAARYETVPVGVWYDGAHWTIFHEDMSAMPVGRAFNVLVIKP